MKRFLSLILLGLVANFANAAPVAYNVTGYAWISYDQSYIVNGRLVMDDTNIFSGMNLDYNMISLDLVISNGSSTYNLNSTDGFMTYFRAGLSATDWFPDGWFIHTDLGTIYDLNQGSIRLDVGSEALPENLAFSLSSAYSNPFYFDPDSRMDVLEFSAAVVPVPAALICLLSGLAGLAVFGRFNKSA